MLMTEYDYDTDIAVQREEAYEDGLSKGAYEKAVETARMLLSFGDSIEKNRYDYWFIRRNNPTT